MATTKIPQELLEKTSITFADNEKLNFGTSDDLQLFHDGSNSIIKDNGTGNLRLQTGNSVNFRNGSGSDVFFQASLAGATNLYHNKVLKLATSSNGVDITGTVELNNLTIAGSQGTDGQLLTSTGSGVAWEDAPASGPTFKAFGTSSIMVGDNATGTINAANYNVGLGVDVFANITTADDNVAIGFEAGKSITNQGDNVFVGSKAGKSNNTYQSTYIGARAGENVVGNRGVGIGYLAMQDNIGSTTGDIGIGFLALQYKNTTDGGSVAIGQHALRGVSNDKATGKYNVAIGQYAMQYYTSAENNIAIGKNALAAVTTPTYNTAIGHSAGSAITTGAKNVLIGRYNGNENNLDIRTSSNNIVLSDGDANIRMRIDSSGNVGIGTTSPDRQLEIEGQGVVRLNATGSNTDSGIDFNTSSASDMQIRYRGGTDKLAVYSYGTTTDVLTIQKADGYIGIGTTSPASPLHVNTSGHTDLFIQSGTSHSSTISLGDSGDQDIGQIGYSNASNFMNFVTNAAERMRIDSAGLVAINTTTVASESALNIGAVAGAGTAEGGQLVLQKGSGGAKAIHIDNYNNASVDYCRFMRGSDTASEAVLGVWDITNTRFGIGTNSPAVDLHVKGAGATNIRLEQGNGSNYGQIKQNQSLQALQLGVGGDFAMTINSAENVGIGTTAPSRQLHVSNSANALAKIESTGANYAGIDFANSSRLWFAGVRTDLSHGFGIKDETASAIRLAIDTSGNVGIGDASPGHKLDVAGNINMSSGTLNLRDDVALDHDGSSLYIKAPSNLYFYPGNSNRGHMDSNGKLILLNGTIQLGATTDYREVKGVYRKNITTSKTFTAAFKVNGGVLGSQFRFSIVGSISNVVINARYEILVNHSYDCLVSSLSGHYTETKVKVVSDGNEDCTVYVGANTYQGATASAIACEVETFNGETIDFDTSNPHTTAHFIHTATAGENTTSTGSMTSGAGTTTAYS